MIPFTQIPLNRLGIAIGQTLGLDASFSEVAKRTRKDGKIIYVIDQKEIAIDDTTTYQGFHFLGRKSGTLTQSFSDFSLPGIEIEVTGSFVLFGHFNCGPEGLWRILPLFNGKTYGKKVGTETISATVNFFDFDDDVVLIGDKYFPSQQKSIQINQQEIQAFEVSYRMNFTQLCTFCVDE